jgi:hypothetical protein
MSWAGWCRCETSHRQLYTGCAGCCVHNANVRVAAQQAQAPWCCWPPGGSRHQLDVSDAVQPCSTTRVCGSGLSRSADTAMCQYS